MVIYDWFAEARGWPPQVVDELDLDQVYWLPILKAARSQAIETLRESNN